MSNDAISNEQSNNIMQNASQETQSVPAPRIRRYRWYPVYQECQKKYLPTWLVRKGAYNGYTEYKWVEYTQNMEAVFQIMKEDLKLTQSDYDHMAEKLSIYKDILSKRSFETLCFAEICYQAYSDLDVDLGPLLVLYCNSVKFHLEDSVPGWQKIDRLYEDDTKKWHWEYSNRWAIMDIIEAKQIAPFWQSIGEMYQAEANMAPFWQNARCRYRIMKKCYSSNVRRFQSKQEIDQLRQLILTI